MKISISIDRLISLGWNFDQHYYGFFINVVNSKEHFEDISVVHFCLSGYKIEYNNRIVSPCFSPYNLECLLNDVREILSVSYMVD